MRWRLLILCAIVGLFAAACDTPQRHSFDGPAGPVSVEFPMAANLSVERDPEGGETRQYGLISSRGTFSLIQMAHGFSTADEMLASLRQTTFNRHPDLQLLNEMRVENNGYPGLELHYERTNDRGTRIRDKVHYYVVGSNLYGVHYAHTAPS